MSLCNCGCGGEAKSNFISGHHMYLESYKKQCADRVHNNWTLERRAAMRATMMKQRECTDFLVRSVAARRSPKNRERQRLQALAQHKADPTLGKRSLRKGRKNHALRMSWRGNYNEHTLLTMLLSLNISAEINLIVPEVSKCRFWDCVSYTTKTIYEVDGCIIHNCPLHGNGIDWNIKRDAERARIAERAIRIGWRFVILWEHELSDGSGYERLS